MGLDCSHDAFSGAYSSFSRLRWFIAKSTGICSFPPHEDKTLDNDMIYFDDTFDKEKYKGLYEFLLHSDCDGEITSEMCEFVARDLELFLPNMLELEKEISATGHLTRNGGFVGTVKKFIGGCKDAHISNEPLLFQ